MRPQQNRRMRGRGNNNSNNRKGPNPLTRSYESNGPDVKIRGSAQQIAEKYATLARDAQSSGDRVIAENYLQHAEHYNRIIAAAQAQVAAQQQQREAQDDDDDRDDQFDQGYRGNGQENGRQENSRQENGRHENGRGGEGRRQSGENAAPNGSGPQPVIAGTPAEVALGEGASEGAGENAKPPRRRQRGAAKTAEQADASGNTGDGTAASEQPAAEGEADEAPRKPRRTRRPRAKAGDEEAGEASSGDKSEGSGNVGEEAA